MKLATWDPFRDLDDIIERYSPFLRSGLLRRGAGGEKDIEWSPAADISETETEYLVKADLPGVDKKDVQITLEDGRLRITGERKIEKKAEGETELRVERFHGTFARTFTLPEDADIQGIQAESSNGSLTVRIPRKKVAARTSPVRIPIK